MRTARVVYGGTIHEATPATSAPSAPGQLRLADGRVVSDASVGWLAPFDVRTIFALALNYADHAQELAAKSSAEQARFLQAQHSEPIILSLIHI
jgi:5-oxopent-3-ene-1,2,5-tricarboxylate decarboxylase/2-hydroxyhepta-2,4-diene-1,7-dioate isomerase